MAYRSSTGDLNHYDESSRPQRWDREKFERYRSRGPESRDSDRFDDRPSSSAGRPRRETDIDINERDGRGRTHIEVIDREYEQERPARRRPEFLDRDEPTPSEVANRALAPYRRQSVVEREHGPPARRPARPQYIRRQSSLDTFDRRPLPRYNDYDREEEWRPPTGVPIPLPIRERRSHRTSVRGEEFVERRRRDSPEYEDYRDIEIRRERSTHRRRRRPKHEKRAPSSSSSSSSDSYRDSSVHASSVHAPSVHAPSTHGPPPPRLPGKKGKTRMPKRLVHKNAIIEKGYEFDEEDDFYIVRRALEKHQIDEVIQISEKYKESRVTYLYEDTSGPVDPPPPPPEFFAPPPPASVHSHHTHHTAHYDRPPPPPPEAFAPPPPPPIQVREVSPPHARYEDHFEQSAHINGPLTSLVPRRPRGEREIREEIRSLEEERRLVRFDRETDYEVVEAKPSRDVIRVEKDRKGRLALVRSSH